MITAYTCNSFSTGFSLNVRIYIEGGEEKMRIYIEGGEEKMHFGVFSIRF
jgi:hypothetical protein